MKIRSALLSIVAVSATAIGLPAAQAAPVYYGADLSGAIEAPPNASPGSGTVLVGIDSDTNQMTVSSTFFGLTGTTSAAHVHCCTAVPGVGTAGVITTLPTFVGFPLGVTAGNFNASYDLNSAGTYNPAFVTAQGSLANARAALVAGLNAGTSYFNIHTSTFPGGEIRGFLQPLNAVPVPEPGTLALLGAGLVGVALVARRQRRENSIAA